MDAPFDSYAESLRTRKGRAWEAYKGLTDAVAAENRSMTAEETEQLERIEADLDGIIAEEKRHAKRVADLNLEDQIAERIAPRVERAERDLGNKADGPEGLNLLAKVALGEQPMGEFRSQYGLNPPAGYAARALGNTPDGGSAVETSFADIFVDYQRTLNPVIAVASVIETADNSPLVIPRKTADQAYGGTVTAEGAGIVAADPTLSSVTLYTYKYPSITFVSAELARSNIINLSRIIAQGAAREIGLDFGTHLTTGDGTDKPEGFLTAATNAGTADGTADGVASWTYFSPDDLVDLFMAPAAPYRPNGSWMLNSAGITKVRTFKDSNGDHMYNPMGEGVTRGVLGSILGRPVYENPAMASPGSAETQSLAFGDFSQYYVRALPLRVDTDASFKFQNDQISIRTIWEGDGHLIDAAAVQYLVNQAV